MAKVRELKKDAQRKTFPMVSGGQIDGAVACAAKIAEYFDRQVAAKGEETAVPYDVPRTIQAYGTGL